MPIDWFTVVAQILNFLVLVWILKRFLYTPVLRAMDDRQKRVEESEIAATQAKEAAAREREEFEKKNRELESAHDSILKKAASEAEAERSRLRNEAREEFQTLREEWRVGLRREQDKLEDELATFVQRETLAVAGQLVSDLADADFQEMLTRKFLEKLKTMSPDERENLREPLAGPGGAAVVRTAAKLGSGLRSEVGAVVSEILGPKVPLSFEVRSELGAGIELAVDGRKVDWTIKSYLKSLENDMRDLVMKKTGGNDGARDE